MLETFSIAAAGWPCLPPAPRPPRRPIAELKQQVTDTERAFAATMKARDHAALRQFPVGRGDLLRRRKQSLAGKETRVVEVEALLRQAGRAVFVGAGHRSRCWRRATLAISSGPVYDPAGKLISRFNSIWRLEAPGSGGSYSTAATISATARSLSLRRPRDRSRTARAAVGHEVVRGPFERGPLTDRLGQAERAFQPSRIGQLAIGAVDGQLRHARPEAGPGCPQSFQRFDRIGQRRPDPGAFIEERVESAQLDLDAVLTLHGGRAIPLHRMQP